MPGHNHYPNCTCGWCCNLGGYTSSSAGISVYQDDVTRAKRTLSEHYVTPRRQAACFVQPNAHCPVCGARVYYYQNAYGSRVFFDDLGGDWPKHPCTDRRTPAPGATNTAPSDFVSVRARTDIVMAALQAGTPLRGTVPPVNRQEGWVLAHIVEVWVFANRKIVLANRLHLEGQKFTAFGCQDPNDLIEADQIISLHDSDISILDPVNFTKVSFPVELWEIPEGKGFVDDAPRYQ